RWDRRWRTRRRARAGLRRGRARTLLPDSRGSRHGWPGSSSLLLQPSAGGLGHLGERVEQLRRRLALEAPCVATAEDVFDVEVGELAPRRLLRQRALGLRALDPDLHEANGTVAEGGLDARAQIG